MSRKIRKLNEYFYMTPEGEILKYKKYCVINDCKKYYPTIIQEKRKFYIVMNIN